MPQFMGPLEKGCQVKDEEGGTEGGESGQRGDFLYHSDFVFLFFFVFFINLIDFNFN